MDYTLVDAAIFTRHAQVYSQIERSTSLEYVDLRALPDVRSDTEMIRPVVEEKNTQPKDLTNHFDLTELAQVKDQAKEYNDFKQAIQALKAQRKGSRIARITPPIPQAAQSDKSSPRPQLQDFSHVVIPLSDVRSQLMNPIAIPDNDAYGGTLKILAFNQDHAKPSKPVIHFTSKPTRGRKIAEILAVVSPTRPQSYRRARTPTTMKSFSPPSPSSNELSSSNELILADTPKVFQHTASTAFASFPSPIPKARRRGPRKPRGPRLGLLVDPANAGPPLFNYCAAVCQLREYKMRVERDAASRRQFSKLRNTVLKALKGVYKLRNKAAGRGIGHADEDSHQAHDQAKAHAINNEDEYHSQTGDQATAPATDHEDKYTSQAHNRAIAQKIGLEDEDEASSDGDPMDIDEPDTAGATQLLQTLIPPPDSIRARHVMRAMTPRPDPPLRRIQPTWHQVQPIPPCEHSKKKRCSQDEKKESSIQDILQTQAKKARKERSQAPTPTTALGSAGSWRNSGCRKSLIE